MPKQAKALSARAVAALSHSGKGTYTRHAVGGAPGLLLHVSSTGARSWLLRARLNGKRGEWGLGAYPEVSLADARQKALEARGAIADGVDPSQKARAKQGMTFAEAVEEYCRTKLDAYRNDKHRAQWRSTLQTYAVPIIGDCDVSKINVHDVIAALEPIWTEKTETASRLRGRIESVLAWATVQGLRAGDNPARWNNNLDQIFPAPDALKRTRNGGGDKRQPALALDDVSHWFALLREREGMAARALEFQALTASRSGAVRHMTWSELDLDAGVWTIQPGRKASKVTRKPHRVPLTKRMRDLISEAKKDRRSDFVFPAPRDGALSDMSLAAVMKRIHDAELREGRAGFVDAVSGLPAVPHGLRSTFRNWASERSEYPREMAEIALGHRIGSAVEQAYFRADMLEKRRAMMTDYGDFLEGKAAKVEARFLLTADEIFSNLDEIVAIANDDNKTTKFAALFK